MPTTTELMALEDRQTALVFAVEGFPVAWTDTPDLVGTSLFPDGREVLIGLVPPSWTLAIDILADWQLARAQSDIKIEDLEGRLGALFGLADGSEEPLYFSVEPGDDLAARPELHDRHVGTEFIGPAGERDYYPLNPAAPRPQLHVGEDSLTALGAVPVATRPIIRDGRRCALYRLFRDVVTYPEHMNAGFVSWRPLSEAVMPWWGTVRRTKHEISGRQWSIHCDGPESWLYRGLGKVSSSEWVHVQPQPTLEGSDETDIVVRLSNERTDGTLITFGEDTLVHTGGLDPIDVRDAVMALIASVAAIDPGGGAFEDLYGQLVRMNLDRSIEIRIEDGAGVANTRRATMTMEAHEKIWLALGYGLEQATLGEDEFVDLTPLNSNPARFEGVFTTRGQDDPALGDWDNGGLSRIFRPLYPTGAAMLEVDASFRPILCTLGFDQITHSGQLDQPVASDPADATLPLQVGTQDADTQGLWLFHGKRRFNDEDEPFDEYQVARCSWRASAGLGLVGGDPPLIRVTRWENPRAFGFDRPRLSTPWRVLLNDPENGIRARPLLRLGYGTPDLDGEDAHVLLQRLLYTTGTSTGWNGYADENPSLPATSNEPVGAPARLDAEVADLGLAIPRDMIAPPAVWDALTHPLESGGIRKAGVSFFPGQPTEDILRSIMATRGWGLGLAGGRYTPFAYDQLVSPSNAVVLSLAAKRTDVKLGLHRTKQTLGATAPKDKYVLLYDGNPVDKTPRYQAELLDPSPSAAYRPTRESRGKGAGGRTHDATVHEVTAPFQRLVGGWRERASDLARWADAGHFMLPDYPLLAWEADVVWPGTRVLLTDPGALNPMDGTWGLAAAQGIVTKVNAVRGGRSVTCNILVDARSLRQLRYHAPSARGRGYNPATRRLYCYDHWLDTPGQLDVQGFVEPPWSLLGGDARIQVNQYNGHTWRITSTGVVQDVDPTPGSSSIRIAGEGLTGRYRRDDEAVITLLPYPDQDAPWVQALFAPISAQDGTWSDGTVVPWEQ